MTNLEIFIAAVKAKCDASHRTVDISYTVGAKYIRVIETTRGTSNPSVFCFVDMDGNILKAAGWKVPAKGIRGHISNGANDVSEYGAAYR